MQGWGFKRFGIAPDIYAREAVRKPAGKPYIEAMERAADAALQQLGTKEKMLLIRSRTAFIYASAWGETGIFENSSGALWQPGFDTLPKILSRKFPVKAFTSTLRGEKQALMNALRLAQDYINWQVFDYVVICCAWRAIPALVFSEEQHGAGPENLVDGIPISVERVGCFIFGERAASGLKVECGRYVAAGQPGATDDDISLYAYTERGAPAAGVPAVNLADIYGASGCMTPALSWIYLEQNGLAQGKMRTIVSDCGGGYHYFDTGY